MRRIVDILDNCTHNGFPVVYSQESRRAVYHEMGPTLPEVGVAVQPDAALKTSAGSPDKFSLDASLGSSDGEIGPDDGPEAVARRPSVRFADGGEGSGTKSPSRRESFASSSSTKTVVRARVRIRVRVRVSVRVRVRVT